MVPRIGFYICHCGTNIAGKVDVQEVAEFAGGLRNVVVARDYKFMCSDPGQEMIQKDIRELGLTRVVVASCSPRLHERTFRTACRRAGLNPYYFQMACVREHCSWVTEDPGEATRKAKALAAAAINRVNFHKSLHKREVGVNPDVLVVGAGIAGIQASLDIARAGYKVHLVEKEPSIGGHMVQFDKTFPTLDCAACISTPKTVAVSQSPNINLLSFSEVVEVKGFVGNYKVLVRRKPRYVREDRCTGCGICAERCPVSIPNEFDEKLGKRKAIYRLFPQAVPLQYTIDREHCIYFKKGRCKACEKFCPAEAVDFDQKEETLSLEVGSIVLATGFDIMDPAPLKNYGYGRFGEVYTGLEFERLNNAVGPTGGRIVMKNGAPPSAVAIVHCVGSRDVNYHAHCSRVCCMYALKYGHLIKEKVGHATTVYNFYIDMRCYGKGYEEFYRRLQEEGVNFVRGKPAEILERTGADGEKKLVVVCEDTLIGKRLEVPVDMAILCTAMTARQSAPEVARTFGINQGADGFFLEEHPKLGPVSTATDGVFLAGTCQGPKDIPDAVSHASGAAAQALALAASGEVEISPVTSWIDPDICAGCQICIGLCPYSAIEWNERKAISEVNEAVCKGCGSCAGFCPSGAARIKHFTPKQVFAEIEGILDEVS